MVTSVPFPARTIATVFDNSGETWWVVGDFSYSWHWDVNEAERFIELREIVSASRKEIIVRDSGGGTGVAETWLSIYHMNNGHLYRVFRTMEDGFHFIVGDGTSEYDHRILEYPDRAWDSPAFVVVRHRKRIEPAEKGQPVRSTADCSVFQWDGATFLFANEKAATPKLCSGRGQ